MAPARPYRAWLVAGLVLAAMMAIGWWAGARKAQDPEPVGLFTTLPILWADNADISSDLKPDSSPHWAREQLAQMGPIIPLDVLAGGPAHDPLKGVRRLVMAQPRVLNPEENVALDNWVRRGGKLLLLADPALTEESSFPLGDLRRPQPVVLLSPILKRWGLELRFDDRQQSGESLREVMGVEVPVNLPGHFETRGQGNCRVWADSLAVTCAIGKGRVVAFADAALLERDARLANRSRAFSWILEMAFTPK